MGSKLNNVWNFRTIILSVLTAAIMVQPAFAAKKHKKRYHTPVPSAESILVVDDVSGDVMVERNADTVRAIASITKLLLAVTYVEQFRNTLGDSVIITDDDTDKIKGTRSGISVGSEFTKLDLLGFALARSDNHAAHALARTSNSTADMVARMNITAAKLGMTNTVIVEPTGLSPHNKSTAADLITLVRYASAIPLVSHLSTSPVVTSINGVKTVKNTNPNIRNTSHQFDYLVSKTGFINEAGGCVVSRIRINGKTYSIVILKSRNRWRDVRYVTNLINTNATQ